MPAPAVKGRRKRAARRRGQYPAVDASRSEPLPGRTWDGLSIRRPYCGGHLGRVRHGAPSGGPKRIRCGMVLVVVRRTYRRTGAAA